MLDFNKIKNYPIKDRKNKFDIKDMFPLTQSKILSDNKDLLRLAESIKKARKNDKQFILMMGAHLIKLGLSNFIIDLIQKNYIRLYLTLS